MQTTIQRIHCSYHKCLTAYYGKVMRTLYTILPFKHGYQHFQSRTEAFYRESGHYRIASLNNHVLDFEQVDNAYVSRFIRDPRDLVVSGYFYHRKGVEKWCNIVDPQEDDWKIVNGNIPVKMEKNHSYSSYLQSLNLEDGLMAEIEFRQKHFESMRQWPEDGARIKTFRYEDIAGHEGDVFQELLAFYQLSWVERIVGRILANKFSAQNVRRKKHIRNPQSGQWEELFSPNVKVFFEQRYSDLLERYGYSTS